MVGAVIRALVVAVCLALVADVSVALSASSIAQRQHKLRALRRHTALTTDSEQQSRAHGPWLPSELWPEGVIPWMVSRDLNAWVLPLSDDGKELNAHGKAVQELTHTAIATIEGRTMGCVHFREQFEESKAAFVPIATASKFLGDETANSATDGSGTNAKQLILRKAQVESPSTVKPPLLNTLLHELGHVAGFQHTFQRSDRDAHVTPYHALPAPVNGVIAEALIPKKAKGCMVTRHKYCAAYVEKQWADATSKPYKATCLRAANPDATGHVKDLLRMYPLHANVQSGAWKGRAHYLTADATALRGSDKELFACAVGACVFHGVQSGNNFELYPASAGYKEIKEYDFHSIMNYPEADGKTQDESDYAACLFKHLPGSSSISRVFTAHEAFARSRAYNRDHTAAGQLTDLDVEMYHTAYGCTKALRVQWARLLEPVADSALTLSTELLPDAWQALGGIAWNRALTAYTKAELCAVAGPLECPVLSTADEAALRAKVRAYYLAHAAWLRLLPPDATLESLAMRMHHAPAPAGPLTSGTSKYAFITRAEYDAVAGTTRIPTFLSPKCRASAFTDEVIRGKSASAGLAFTLVAVQIGADRALPDACA